MQKTRIMFEVKSIDLTKITKKNIQSILLTDKLFIMHWDGSDLIQSLPITIYFNRVLDRKPSLKDLSEIDPELAR